MYLCTRFAKNGAQEKAIFDRSYIKTEVVVQEASAGLPRARSFIIIVCVVSSGGDPCLGRMNTNRFSFFYRFEIQE